MVSHEEEEQLAMALEERVRRATRERRRWEAMRRAFATGREEQEANLERMKDIEGRKRRLQEVRERTLLDPDLIDEAVENMERAGFRVRMAADAGEALDMVVEEMGEERLLVKSKTNVSKEIHLTRRMTEMGYQVVETDLGDRIIQIADTPSSHPTGPAAHLDRHQVTRRQAQAAWDDDDLREAAKMYASGLSLAVVADRFRIDAQTVANRFRRAGVRVRTRRGWPSRSATS